MIELKPMNVILGMAVDELGSLAQEVGRVETKAKDASEAHKLSFPMAGKVVYAVQKLLEYLKSSKDENGAPKKPTLPLDMSLSTYWEIITKANGKKGSKLNNHWLSCAVCFGTYVDSELITEADYDKNPGSNLELAASISTAVDRDLDHAAINAAAEELRDRSKSAAKNLRAILDSVKEPKALSTEKAQELIAKLFASGHLTLVISSVGAEIAHLEDPELARSAYFGLVTANEMFAANTMTKENGADGKPVLVRRFTDEMLSGWSANYAKSNAKAPEQTAPTPPAPAPAQLEAAAA